ncbi:notch-regulated ankyrin repeat-containing protein A isoform X1 [Hippocampus comes]|uniref:notch-regulated ankyrin repeat-containing protein A isoform X1 n=1 Tax=Hippocampus comes TaxID=109280 RepID=UPI00094EED4C|nr:PREDICTED: notch-regulated ankyrin repeat-containing protein isoform X1 [Hippocampus comes]
MWWNAVPCLISVGLCARLCVPRLQADSRINVGRGRGGNQRGREVRGVPIEHHPPLRGNYGPPRRRRHSAQQTGSSTLRICVFSLIFLGDIQTSVAKRECLSRRDYWAPSLPLPLSSNAAMSQADVSTCSAPQRVFQEAVKRGNTKELHSLLQNMTNCEFNVNSFGPEGQTALHQSVIDGNLELVKLLVKFGADIRLANREGWSALHIAAFGGHQDIVLYLITKAKYSSGAR